MRGDQRNYPSSKNEGLRIATSSLYQQLGKKPFNPFFITHNDSDELLYFTQTFATYSGYHPSTNPSAISVPNLEDLNLGFQHIGKTNQFRIFQSPPNPLILLEERNKLAKNLDHELRTVALLLNLCSEIITKDDQEFKKPFKILLRTSRRQKTVTLVYSHFIQLITTPPDIFSISFMDFLNNIYDFLLSQPQVKFKSKVSFKQILSLHIDPKIYGNLHFLSHFFRNIFFWLETIPLSFEIRSDTPISLQVMLSTPTDNVSKIQSYPLMSHLFHFFSTYFNYRFWTTQNSIRIEFPIVL
ncbi:MAG: hypothetical protein ACFFAJ_04050 [Candidatus Hodarchaeota archaeon]